MTLAIGHLSVFFHLGLQIPGTSSAHIFIIIIGLKPRRNCSILSWSLAWLKSFWPLGVQEILCSDQYRESLSQTCPSDKGLICVYHSCFKIQGFWRFEFRLFFWPQKIKNVTNTDHYKRKKADIEDAIASGSRDLDLAHYARAVAGEKTKKVNLFDSWGRTRL